MRVLFFAHLKDATGVVRVEEMTEITALVKRKLQRRKA